MALPAIIPAVAKVLGELALFAGIGWVTDFIERGSGLTQNQAMIATQQILNAAANRGQRALDQVISRLNAVPQLYSSPKVQEFIARTKSKLKAKADDISKKYVDMVSKVEEQTSNLQNLSAKDPVTKLVTGASQATSAVFNKADSLIKGFEKEASDALSVSNKIKKK